MSCCARSSGLVCVWGMAGCFGQRHVLYGRKHSRDFSDEHFFCCVGSCHCIDILRGPTREFMSASPQTKPLATVLVIVGCVELGHSATCGALCCGLAMVLFGSVPARGKRMGNDMETTPVCKLRGAYAGPTRNSPCET